MKSIFIQPGGLSTLTHYCSTSHEKRIVQVAVGTRVIVWILAMLSRFFVTEYDSSTEQLIRNMGGNAFYGYDGRNQVEEGPLLSSLPWSLSFFGSDGLGGAVSQLPLSWDYTLKQALSVFLKWDSFYFLHIAENGYIYEHQLAFFPLLPWLMRILALPLNDLLGHRLALLFAGCLISNVSFVLAALALYR